MLRIGHRGTTSGGIENTLTAFRKALGEGGDGVELDIRRSRDGVLVISHDPKVDRLTDGSGYVKDLTLAELKGLSVHGSNEKIATAAEAFDTIVACGKPKLIQVDLKVPGVARQLLDQIYNRDLQDVVVISSFHKSLLKEIRGLDGSVKTGLIKIMPQSGPIEYLASETEENMLKLKVKDWLYHAYLYSMLLVNRVSGSAGADLITDAKDVGADYVMFYWRAGTKSFVRKAHENGLRVVAGMVNNERGIRRLERIGVDAVVTDLSELLRHN